MNVRAQDEPARRGPFEKQAHESSADPLRKVVEEAGAVDEIILPRQRGPAARRALEQIVNRLVHDTDAELPPSELQGVTDLKLGVPKRFLVEVDHRDFGARGGFIVRDE